MGKVLVGKSQKITPMEQDLSAKLLFEKRLQALIDFKGPDHRGGIDEVASQGTPTGSYFPDFAIRVRGQATGDPLEKLLVLAKVLTEGFFRRRQAGT